LPLFRGCYDDGVTFGGPFFSNNMVISSVPEPKTSVMMITALGLLGLVGGRRGPDRNRKTCFYC
jgi:hypothetical protein